MSAPCRQVTLLVFDEVEELDLCGPLEVFAVAGRESPRDGAAVHFRTCTVAETTAPVVARHGLRIVPDFDFKSCPPSDILLVPGGWGTRRLLDHRPTLDWIGERSGNAELVLSVCTGALLLGRIGMLDGLRATTHHAALDLLGQVAPRCQVCGEERIVDNGRIVLSAGVAAGIDMSFHVVARLLGVEHARRTAEYIEYPWTGDR